MANYGGFRYYHWATEDNVQIYEASDTSLQDWGYDCIESLRMKYVQELKNGTWASVDYQVNNDNDISSYNIGTQTARYVHIKVFNAGERT